MNILLGLGTLIGLGGLAVFTIILAMAFRIVVNTNFVHVVQKRNTTVPYGRGQAAGNVYWRWPSWVPYFGLKVIELPISNFDLDLRSYEAYDQDRVPFVCDIVAFFRVSDPAKAAQRVSSMQELEGQLLQIVQGAVRKVLASDVIDTIMLERAKFGNAFTAEIAGHLDEWGVENVKSMELMDIRDPQDESTRNVQNIMLRKSSDIERQTRTEVANNDRDAKNAEIDAARAVAVRQQEAEQVVGERTAEKEKMVGIANEKSHQEVLTEERETKERTMQVQRVNEVREAEISRDKQIVVADQDRQTRVIVADGEKQARIVSAEGDKESTVIKADGDLQAEQKRAQAIEAVGMAEGEAKTAINMADVNPQIALAKEIGENQGYQNYLVTVEAIKMQLEVGTAQAQALQDADVKVIANSSRATDGLNSVGELMSSKGGTDVAAFVEGLAQTPLGKAALEAFGVETPEGVAATLNAKPKKRRTATQANPKNGA